MRHSSEDKSLDVDAMVINGKLPQEKRGAHRASPRKSSSSGGEERQVEGDIQKKTQDGILSFSH